MERKKFGRQRTIHSYHLSPDQLAELHRKYGRPGEMSPGRPAPKKRNRLDAALAAMDRKDTSAIIPIEENEMDADIT
ncbi:MAG: hypothetical protein ACOY46_08375 [Bacillota bacterium]